MEAELKPRVLETFDRIAEAYKKLRKLQDQNVADKLARRRRHHRTDEEATRAQGSRRRGCEEPVAQQKTASRRWLNSFTTSTSA